VETPDASKIVSLEKALKQNEPAQIYKPGTVCAYSNWGASLAAYIVESITGEDFCHYVHKHIFEPLGMQHTAIAPNWSDNTWVSKQRQLLKCYSITQNTHEDYGKSKKVNELLDLMFQYAKLDSLDFEMKLQEVDLGRLIRDAVALHYNEFEIKNIELNIEIPQKPIKKELDNLEFSRAISNLIVNAYKHNKNGSKVNIRLEDNDGIKIIVADNGENIADEIKETIFNPFICGDESRNSKAGSGLGLAITKKIIDKHGGKIFIDSNIEGYTKAFVIEL
jgi:signal transduction histidine kinase